MSKIRISVKPNSNRDSIEQKEDGSLLVRIKAKPINGEANDYLIAFLAKEWKVAKSKLKLTNGHHSSYKTIELEE